MNDLAELFAIHLPVWEIVLRGTVVYLTLFATFRFIVRRDIGGVGIADILVLVLVADAAQNAMSGDYNTIGEGLILVATLVAWNVLFDVLSYKFKAFERFAQPSPLLLVKDGKVLHRNLRKEFVTTDELEAKLRSHGVEHPRDVVKAYLESDGEFTVISRKEKSKSPPPPAPKDKITP